MNRSHIHAHAQVVEALGGHAPRKPPHTVAQYNDGTRGSQINPPSRRSNFRDRSNRRKTTGFEEIRQEYYQIHKNRATTEPAEEGSAVHHQPQTANDPEEFFPKPSAFIKAPRRTLPPRRPIHTVVDDTELFDGGGFRTRGSKAADLFQRRRERTDQFIIEQQDNPTPPHISAPTAITLTQQGQNIQIRQSSSREPASHQPVGRTNAPSPHRKPQMESNQPRRSSAPPPQQSRRQEPVYHDQQQQYHHQQQQQAPPPQSYHSNETHQSQRRSGHTTVDSRRTRKPLAPASPRFDINSSPWNDRNMEPGKRFHPNVIPYQDSYNTSPKGWGGASAGFGNDNNVKYQYTNTTEKFKFTPAPRINTFGSGLSTPHYTNNYNSRPKSWGDIENNHPSQAPPPSRRAYPTPHRQSSESSANRFAGPSSRGYGESDEL